MNELDSIRGLAAFIVVLHHLWETILPDQNTYPFLGDPIAGTGLLADVAFWISLSPLRLLFSGHAAVGVFFVLSGFALTKSIQQSRDMRFGRFMIRRFFRIYPPFALVIVSAALLCLLIAPQPIPGREWINLSWSHPITPQLVLGHLAMLTTSDYYTSLNSPMWTLVHELRVSALFLLLVPFVVAYPRVAFSASIGVFAVFSIRHFTAILGGLVPEGLSRDIFLSFIETARYVMFFVFGILVATRFETFQVWLVRYKQWIVPLWILAFALLAVPYAKGYLEICYALGALILITLCIHSQRARSILNRPALSWLGKVSYSLYLSHQVVLIAFVYLLHDKLPIGVILGLVLVSSLILADIMNRTVELPSSALGKRIANIGLAKKMTTQGQT